MNNGPSAFAPSRMSRGRTLQWESLALNHPQNLLNVFPNATTIVGTHFVTLLPGNVLKKTVTLLRVRGSANVMWPDTVDLFTNTNQMIVRMSMQLVPLRNGAIVVDAVLHTDNSADLESNRILWQHAYVKPLIQIAPGGAVHLEAIADTAFEVDVKVKRRFDRSAWALIMVATGAVVADTEPAILAHLDLRALFATTEGI